MNWFLIAVLFLGNFGLSLAQVPSPEKKPKGAAQFLEGLKVGEVPQATLRGVLPEAAFFKDCSHLSENARTLCKEKNPHKLSDLARILSETLSHNGYGEQSWYFNWRGDVKNSLVVLTQVEQIQDDGHPRSGSARWSLDYSNPKIDSIKSFVLTLLKGAPPGRYRFFLFGFSYPAGPLNNVALNWEGGTESLAMKLVGFRDTTRAASRVPLYDSLKNISASGLICQVFVYEYEVSPTDGSATFLKDIKGLSVEDHLKGAGIWQTLELKTQ